MKLNRSQRIFLHLTSARQRVTASPRHLDSWSEQHGLIVYFKLLYIIIYNNYI